jgi:hypothetical protein
MPHSIAPGPRLAAPETAQLEDARDGSTSLHHWEYNKQRTVYVRTAPEEPPSGLSLSLDLFDGVEPGSPDEAETIMGHLVDAWNGKLDDTDGYLFEPEPEALRSPALNPFANSCTIAGARIEWTVVDPEVEPMVLQVTRTTGYTVTGTYVVRLTRAEYEDYVDANDGDEDGALEEILVTTHRGSPDAPDPRVTFVGEVEEEEEEAFSTESELIDEGCLPDPMPPRPPYLDEATDEEIRAEVARRLGLRQAARKRLAQPQGAAE